MWRFRGSVNLVNVVLWARCLLDHGQDCLTLFWSEQCPGIVTLLLLLRNHAIAVMWIFFSDVAVNSPSSRWIPILLIACMHQMIGFPTKWANLVGLPIATTNLPPEGFPIYPLIPLPLPAPVEIPPFVTFNKTLGSAIGTLISNPRTQGWG